MPGNPGRPSACVFKRSGFPASRGRVSLSRPEPIFRRGGTTGLDPAEGRFRVGGDPRVAHSPLSWTDRLVVDAAADHASEPRPRSRSGHFLPNRAPWHVLRAPLRVRRVAEPDARSEETESPPQAPPPPPDLNAPVGHRSAPPCGWWVLGELAHYRNFVKNLSQDYDFEAAHRMTSNLAMRSFAV